MNFGPPGTAPLRASSHSPPEAAASQFLERLKRPCRLLVAYSGGGDSTGLLVALAALRPAFPHVAILAATVDHRLRPGSTEEAAEAGRLCAALDVPHVILAWNGIKPRAGIQAAARAARYHLLAEHAHRAKVDFIVMAHTFEDQQETVAMRQARDPATTDGMEAAVLVERSIWVLRPFLDVRRNEIRNYLRQRRIGWIDDPSNDNPAFERIRIRQADVVPEAKPGLGERDASSYERAAAFLQDCVIVRDGLVAEMDLASSDFADASQRIALLSLAAFLGGRNHIAGKKTAARLFDFLGQSSIHRFAAERVVFDRRGASLFVGREARGLSTLSIPAGGTVIWDNRFHVENRGREAVTIGPDPAGRSARFVQPPADTLPRSVRHRAEATLPHCLAGDPGALQTRIVIPQFEYFAPVSRLPVANALAKLVGLEHFPSLSLG